MLCRGSATSPRTYSTGWAHGPPSHCNQQNHGWFVNPSAAGKHAQRRVPQPLTAHPILSACYLAHGFVSRRTWRLKARRVRVVTPSPQGLKCLVVSIAQLDAGRNPHHVPVVLDRHKPELPLPP
nr:hypothetical protein CFP56_00257 [Quercus suber]